MFYLTNNIFCWKQRRVEMRNSPSLNHFFYMQKYVLHAHKMRCTHIWWGIATAVLHRALFSGVFNIFFGHGLSPFTPQYNPSCFNCTTSLLWEDLHHSSHELSSSVQVSPSIYLHPHSHLHTYPPPLPQSWQLTISFSLLMLRPWLGISQVKTGSPEDLLMKLFLVCRLIFPAIFGLPYFSEQNWCLVKPDRMREVQISGGLKPY